MKPWPWQTAPDAPRVLTTEQLLDKQRRQVAFRRGLQAQEIVGHHLRRLGIACLWRVHTGTRKVRGKRAFTGKVEGDWRGLRPHYGGQAVLCEVKARPDVLSLSDFEPHQLRALQEHHEANGLALVAWVRGTDVAIMAWPIAELRHQHPLQWADADRIHLLNPAF